jgi:hypothetical protein
VSVGLRPAGPEERLRQIHRAIHQRPTSGLCLSGGGIRSGTFALGVMQGLAHLGVLGKFDYLSTVSGGGYTGGSADSRGRAGRCRAGRVGRIRGIRGIGGIRVGSEGWQ